MQNVKELVDHAYKQAERTELVADMLKMLHDMLVDDMPAHQKAQKIRVICFAAIDVANTAGNGILKLIDMLDDRAST